MADYKSCAWYQNGTCIRYDKSGVPISCCDCEDYERRVVFKIEDLPERNEEMSARETCYTCKHYKHGLCDSADVVICGDDMSGWELSDDAKADLLHDAEPVVIEKAEPESVKVKSICNNCFWWNKTCHNKKSCCYGEYKDYNGFCGWFEPANAETNVAAEIFKAQNHDVVNHPNHYTQGEIECIDALKSATTGLQGIEAVCTANAIKYLWRWKNKNGVQDIDKAIWYLNRLKKELE